MIGDESEGDDCDEVICAGFVRTVCVIIVLDWVFVTTNDFFPTISLF